MEKAKLCHTYLGHFDTSRGMPASLEGVGGHRDKSMSNGHGESEVSQKRDAALEVSNCRNYCQKLPLAFLALVSRRPMKCKQDKQTINMTATRDTSHDVQLVNPVPPAVTRLANQRAANGRSSRVGSDLEAFQTSVW